MFASSRMKSGFLAVLMAAAVSFHAPVSVADTVDDAMAHVPYLIVGSFKSYAGAMRHVTMIHARTGIPVELRNLVFSKGVLSLTPDDCERMGAESAGAECWEARGRSYNGIALSIERSDWYPSMRPGYYIVVAETGAGEEDLGEARAALAPAGIKGYLSYVWTYVGCRG